MNHKNSLGFTIFKIIMTLLILQGIRIAIKQIVFIFVEESITTSNLIALSEMTLFIVLFRVISTKRGINLSVFPDLKKRKNYIAYFTATAVLLVLILLTPTFNGGFTSGAIIPLIISAVATPIFEELIFRGYLWNELEPHFKNEFTIYIITTLLFAVWHLGYADTIWFRMSLTDDAAGFPFAMFMKVVTGLCFGIIIGYVRYKCKNCYAAILAHSFMNLFGR